jgi:hypothetical protein
VSSERSDRTDASSALRSSSTYAVMETATWVLPAEATIST